MTFLKSINVVEDLTHPVRAAHYRPTSRSLEILQAILGMEGSAATSVIGTYGSGKSIAAMVGGLLVEADPRKVDALGEAGSRVLAFEPAIAAHLASRQSRGTKGLVVALNGFVPDLPRSVAAFLGLPSCDSMADLFTSLDVHLRRRKADRLAIVWDEFGRHLEALVSRGRAEDLAQVQDLAEWVVRRKAPSATLTLLLHQEFHRYAGRLGQVEQAAWRKIEGRFDALRIVEDSDEIYQVIADVTQDLSRVGQPEVPTRVACLLMDLRLFPFLPDLDAATALACRAAPLSPAALYLLPKIAGRVGQSERSTFGFLGDELPDDREAFVGIEDLWRYFSDAMRTDTGVGGSHKRYVEAEAARSRAPSEIEREVIAAAALLHLTAGSTRALVSRERLLSFLEIGTRWAREALEAAVDSLLARKLLLHRHLTDEISVWQGSDVDVRARVEEEMEALRTASGSQDRIARHVPAPSYLAPAYNHDKAMTRFARAVFVDMAVLRSPEGQKALCDQADASDALVALVTDGSREDYPSVSGEWLARRPHLILAFARERPDLVAACLRVEALTAILGDEHLLEMDPLIAREVLELKADALDYLVARSSALTEPEAGNVSWFAGGKSLGKGRELNPAAVLTSIMSRRFPMTPIVRNDQIVRCRITAQTKSARRRLLLGILERSRVAHMGYAGATSSDASIYRTTLEATALFDGSSATWASPDDPSRLEPGMRLAWSLLRGFFADPANEPKPFRDIIDALATPPIGLRAGLVPILLTAGLRAFGELLAIRQRTDGRWTYLDDIQPSIMEAICEAPDEFEIEVLKASHVVRDRIRRLTAGFAAHHDTVETDLVRAFHDGLLAWQLALPPAAMTARGLGSEAGELQRALRQTRGDPVSLLFRALPAIAGRPALDEATLAFVEVGRRQMELVIRAYADEAICAARRAFEGQEGQNLVMAARAWADLIPVALSRGSSLDQVALGILNRARKATPDTESDVGFARALAGMLIGRTFDKWSDAEARAFERGLQAKIREIEDAALAAPVDQGDTAPFLKRRIGAYVEKLSGSMPPDELRSFVLQLIGDRR